MKNHMNKQEKIKIVDFDSNYLEEAVELFIENYRILQQKYARLPIQYGNKKIIMKLLNDLLQKNYGVVALIEGKVVGYLTGVLISEFKSTKKGVYTPEWAHTTVLEGRKNIYVAMHDKISKRWHKDGSLVHAITLLGEDSDLINQLFWTGYGMHVIDAIKNVHNDYQLNAMEVNIRIAEQKDVVQLTEILEEHIEYMASSPIYLYSKKASAKEEIESWLNDRERILWVAEKKGELTGYLNVIWNATNACTIVRDKKILAIQGTHVREKDRSLGIGKALLNRANQYAIDNGYEILSVDFETANESARRFWLKHFEPICYSFLRYIDDRTI